MADRIELTLDDRTFQRLLAVLDQIDQRIDRIDGSLKTLRRNSSRIEFRFEGVNDLTQLINLLDRTRLNQLTKVIRSLNELSTINVGRNQFDPMVRALERLGRLSVGQDLQDISKTADRLGSGLKKLFSALNDINIGNTKKIGTFVLALQSILGIINLLGRVTPGAAGVRSITITMQQLGIGISGLFRNIEKITPRNVARLSLAVGTLTLVLKVLSNFAGKSSGIQSLAKTFESVARVLNLLFTGIDVKNAGKSKNITKVLFERIQLITTIIKEIRKIKGKNLDNVGPALDGLGRIVKATKDLDDQGGLRGNGIKSLKDIIFALRDLSNIRIQGGIGQALSGIGNLFSSGQARQLQGRATSFGGNLSGAISDGFISAFVRIRLFDFIARAFLALNPVTLTARFVSGVVSAFVTLKARVLQILNETLQRLRAFGDQLTNIGQNLIRNFGVGALLQSEGFGLAVQFDDLSNRARAFGNLTDGELKRVQDLANAIGIQFPLSSNEALEAIINLEKAGLGVDQIEAAIAPIANLATLSESGSIDQASRSIIQIINSFDELQPGVASNFENTAIAVDIMSRAADASVASTESLALGLENVGPAARAFGLTFEETIAALALFENSGIRGAEAGTQLRTVLRSLQSDRAREQLRALGVEIADEEGNFKDLNTIINELNDALFNTQTVTRPNIQLTEEQSNRLETAQQVYARTTQQILLLNNGLTTGSLDAEEAATRISELTQVQSNAQRIIEEVAGSQEAAGLITSEITRTQEENSAAVIELAGAYGQLGLSILLTQGEDGLQAFIAQMNELPSAAERAAIIMSSFSGTVEQLRGSVQTLLTNAFVPLLDTVFRPFVELALNVTNAILRLDQEILALVSTAIAFTSIFATIVGGGLIFIGVFLKLGAIIAGVGVTLASFSGAISIAVGLVAGFASFILGLITAFAALAVFTPIILGLAAGFRLLVNIFTQGVGGAEGAAAAFDRLKGRISGLVDVIREFASTVGNIIGFLFSGGAAGFQDPRVSLIEQVSFAIAAAFDRIGSRAAALRQTVRNINDFFSTLFNVTTQGAESETGVNRLLRNPLLAIILGRRGEDVNLENAQALINRLRGNLNQIKDVITNMTDAVRTFISSVASGESIGDAFNELLRHLNVGIGSFFIGVSNFAQELTGRALFSPEVMERLFASDLGGAVQLLIQSLSTKIREALLRNRDNISDILTSIFSTFFVPGKIFRTIANFLGIDQFVTVFDEFERVVVGLFRGIIDTIFNLLEGNSLSVALRRAFGPGIAPLLRFLRTLGRFVDQVFGLFRDIFGIFAPEGFEFGNISLIDIINDGITTLTNILNFFIRDIIGPLREFIQSVDLQAIVDFIGDLFNRIGEFFGALLSGDFNFAFDTIKQVASNFINAIGTLLTSILDSLTSGSIEGGTQSISGALGELFGRILGEAARLIQIPIDFGVSLVNKVLEAIRTFLGDDPGAKFAEIGTTIVRAIGDAVIGAFTTAADVLGLDPAAVQQSLSDAFQSLIDAINRFFQGDDSTGSIFENIATILSNVGTAINNVIDAILRLFGTNLEEAAAAAGELPNLGQIIFDFVGNLVALGIEAVTDTLNGLADFFDRLAQVDSSALLSVGGAIGFVGRTILLAFLPAVAALIALGFERFVLLITQLGTAVFNILNFLSLALILKNIADNLGLIVDFADRLIAGDIEGTIEAIINFFGQVASGITFDLLGLFGIDTLFGQTQKEIEDTVALIAKGVPIILQQALADVQVFFETTIRPILNFLATAASVILTVGLAVAQVAIRVASVSLDAVIDAIGGLVGAIQDFLAMPEEQRNSIIQFLIALAGAIFLLSTTARGAILAQVGSLLFRLGTFIGGLVANGAALSGFASVLRTVFTRLLPLLVIITFALSALENVAKLLDSIADFASGDFAGGIASLFDFIASTALDASFTLFDLLGIDIGVTREQLEQTLDQLVFLIEIGLRGIGNSISLFIEDSMFTILNTVSNTLLDIALEIKRIASEAEATLTRVDPDTLPFQAAADAIEGLQTGSINFGNLFFGGFNRADELFGERGGEFRDNLDLFMRRNAVEVGAAFADQFIASANGTLAEGDVDLTLPGRLTESVGFLIERDIFDDALRGLFENADPTVVTAFFDNLNNIMPGLISQGIIDQTQADAIVNQIMGDVRRGNIDPQQAIDVLNLLDFGVTGELSEEKRNEAIDQIQRGIDEIARLAAEGAAIADGEGGAPIDVPVTVGDVTVTNPQAVQEGVGFDLETILSGGSFAAQPTVLIAPTAEVTNATDLAIQAASAVEEAIETTPQSAAPDIPVTPLLTDVDSAEDVQELSGDVVQLGTDITATESIFVQFVNTITLRRVDLQNFSTEMTLTADNFEAQVDRMQTRWTVFTDELINNIQRVIAKLVELIAKFILFGITVAITTPIIILNIGLLRFAFTVFANQAISDLTRITNKLEELNTFIQNAIQNFSDLRTASQDGLGSTAAGAPQFPEQRALGGPVNRGIFQVIEDNVPELLFQNGRTYLLSPSGGHVAPIEALPALQTFGGVPRPAADFQTGFGGGIVFNEGDLTIQIDNAGGQPPQQIAESVRTVVQQELAQRDARVRERLRTAGR